MKRRFWKGILGAMGLWWMAAPQAAELSCAEGRYSVWLIPRLSAVTMHRAWAPFLERLGKETGLCLEPQLSASFGEFEAGLARGLADFAYLNPYHEVVARRAQGYEPLVRDNQLGLAGVIVVRRGSPIEDIQGLAGQSIAFPAPNAYAASLLTQAYLGQEGIAITPLYLGSHGNVYRAVVMGDVAAGGGANSTFLREPEELRRQLHVLYMTPASMPHPFAVHPRVPVAVRERVVAAFLGLAADESGKRLLEGIQVPEPVRADYARDYLPLEQLGLDKLSGVE